ncbi:MAG: alpha/beta fold hydrolase, partial [Gemmatimonadaceae bacterium]
VVGHSMGSFVAQQVALAAPARVAGLVLVGSATSVRGFEGMLDLQRTVDSLGDPVPREFVREFQYSTVHQPLPAAFMDRAIAESLKLPARVWRGVAAGMLVTDEPMGLADKGIPTLILWGDRDTIFPRSEQDALCELIPGATLKVYPETGHALHWERPAEFVRDLEEFVAAKAAR